MNRTYVALLRGINVGGNNIIRMADLKRCFEAMGHRDVKTFIQSGNVIFRANTEAVKPLTLAIEAALSHQFGYRASVVVLSRDALADAVASAPRGFGTQPDKYRYDVIFLKPPLTAAAALDAVTTTEGVDTVAAGKQALYFSRLISKASQSRLSRIATSPIYPSITIRNWNTTTKLIGLMG